MDKRIYWIWISRMKGIGIKKIKILLDKYKSVENLWNAKVEDLRKIKNIGEKTISELLNNDYKKGLNKYLEYMVKNKINIIDFQDEKYPNQLLNIYDPPSYIYVMGNEKNLENEMIAIVGSRKCSNYGKIVAMQLSEYISKLNITVVSGLAKGIDSYSHEGALKEKGKTIAVLGSGFTKIYPRENILLARKIVDNGGTLISEYSLEEGPSKLNFPARNRIISGLSNKIVVVEANENSGSLITVDYALDQGKEVYAVPGNITSNLSKGTNGLIKEGAIIVNNYEDIIKN